MKLHRPSLVLICLLAAAPFSRACLGQTGRSCRIEYANQNQIDYEGRPRVGVSGTVIDRYGKPIPSACVAVFDEKDHHFVAGRMSDTLGGFHLPLLEDGRYRLVAELEGFGIANMTFNKVSETRADSPLYVHMLVRSIDVTSYIDSTKQVARQ